MKAQLYLWPKAAEFYKEELAFVKKYYNKTKIQFDNIEEEAEKFAKEFFNDYPGDENTDPSEITEIARDKSAELYQMLSLMKSNHLLITILMLYGIWEQQIINFTVSELRKNISRSIDRICFSDLKKIHKAYNNDITQFNCWSAIEELKLLNNTIKHSIGESSDKLKKIRPDFFISEYLPYVDTLDLFGTTLTSVSLQVQEKDLDKYIRATSEFWDEMPESSFADTNDILKILKKNHSKNNNMEFNLDSKNKCK